MSVYDDEMSRAFAQIDQLRGMQDAARRLADAMSPMHSAAQRIAEQMRAMDQLREVTASAQQLEWTRRAVEGNIAPLLRQHNAIWSEWQRTMAQMRMPWLEHLSALKVVPNETWGAISDALRIRWSETFTEALRQPQAISAEFYEAATLDLVRQLEEGSAGVAEELDPSAMILQTSAALEDRFPGLSRDTVIQVLLMLLLAILSLASSSNDSGEVIKRLDKLIAIQEPPRGQGSSAERPQVEIIKDAHIRDGPAAAHRSLCKAPAGTYATASAEQSGWIHITFKNDEGILYTGWVSRRFARYVR